MSRLIVSPGPLKGEVAAPPSKSLLHRALIASALAGGGTVSPLADSQDILATLQGLEALGARFSREKNSLRLESLHAPERLPEIDCLESGSTLRFLLPLALVLAGGARFRGRGRLAARPLEAYREIFLRQGASWEKRPGEELDLTVRGRLISGEFSLPGDVSSQFVTGLLFSLPLLSGDSSIRLTTPPQSKSYIDLTLDALHSFGVSATEVPGGYLVPGGQAFQPRDFAVEGDWSQAAVWLAADALGAEIWVTGMNAHSRQGDRAALAILSRMGAEAVWEGDRVRVFARELRGAAIDAADCPDIIPILALVAACARGETVIQNAGRLRLKECDRLEATRRELNRLGAQAAIRGDALVIQGSARLRGCRGEPSRDHRMAMLLAVAGAFSAGPVEIPDWPCVDKSYPDFFRDFQRLGGQIHEQ